MIFALFGTCPYPFTALLTALDDFAAKSGEAVVVQHGHTPAAGSNVTCQAFFSPEEIKKQLQSADIIVTHGGFGSIREALQTGKPVIAVPRRRDRGEYNDDHQQELVWELAAQKRLHGLDDPQRLTALITAIRGGERELSGEAEPERISELVAAAVERWLG